MTTNSFQTRLLALLLDGIPLIHGSSIVRVAASAYRPDRISVTRDEIDRRWSCYGEVTVRRIGGQFFIVEPPEFDNFRRSAAKDKA
ncbi:TPA: hypothetical protein QDC51_001253 [Burkholderia multivorans]|uniref:hypothetical protein n=1 Tax=Burkholderia multivorans TaxID=87883 RepID=UPI001C214E0A|nr:hypothetical protein [Burkholderia multivorans]MBU9351723.1 hypothetical protein [Burkholderia multivorans]MBU9394922.1 hypothetical protein [Burkholderia multivorans]HDR9834494.1 hypothetical protein [Burkholderia multivorans]HDR9840438.1 hypothetical protein [Burkholderia multivorans]HDR9846441.1 hypothetical protein [Burkholderia multivorans]